MPEQAVQLMDAQNAFVRQAADRKKLADMVRPLEARIKALEERVAKLETTKAPKGKE